MNLESQENESKCAGVEFKIWDLKKQFSKSDKSMLTKTQNYCITILKIQGLENTIPKSYFLLI